MIMFYWSNHISTGIHIIERQCNCFLPKNYAHDMNLKRDLRREDAAVSVNLVRSRTENYTSNRIRKQLLLRTQFPPRH